MKKPVVLTIIDGLGFDSNKKANAFKLAKTPTLDDLLENYPNVKLKASGEQVGLPDGQIGNSEVGHLNIGAGQIVYTGLSLIAKTILDGTFMKNEAFLQSIKHVKEHGTTMHVMGLLSPGGVHSLEAHLFEILKLLHKQGITDVTLHAFTDGRDVDPRSVLASLTKVLPILKTYGYKLGSIQGRLYAMDRDADFTKTEQAFEALQGRATNSFTNVVDYINDQYNNKNLNDEFIDPAVNQDVDVKFLSDNDGIILFNFRPDRSRQLSHLFVGSQLYDVKANHPVKGLNLTIMMPYEGIKAHVAFDSMKVQNTLGSVVSKAGFKQIRIAETQKYAHVTFFMDGGVDIQLSGASRILIPSLKISDFSKAPEMSAQGITDMLLPELSKVDLVIMNYANPDMVGHTGVLSAAIAAVEFIDLQIKVVKAAIDKLDGTMFITADHGNVEIMADEKGNPVTKHTTSDVPFISTDQSLTLTNGSLANVAPTIIDYLGLEIPASMDHESLIK
ncbi:2,3-bisphosphoglycerate-independent phosphoglycerate mutase [Candidatus Mycoplasma mahonii]|uniref:2,3-bisphosphoglycerate-independent phosphoglycerate mutase n=1 Tax=Candidatus Mycoplasma mahonii TaxID=3004105 RepID=UPI0026EA1571|nr:2,3-bisphosphoglycerate-independent phosphoglycerate mutase [Candidatus Mycoplasma mahonii]WKX02350.1 2,3-bisphosphoglycerate-independent phosphoglycerate mutase [Candidatus Mycoplasma mahonii]